MRTIENNDAHSLSITAEEVMELMLKGLVEVYEKDGEEAVKKILHMEGQGESAMEKLMTDLQEYAEATEIISYAVVLIQRVIDDLIVTNNLKLSQGYLSAKDLREKEYREGVVD